MHHPSIFERERERDLHVHIYMYVCVCVTVCVCVCTMFFLCSMKEILCCPKRGWQSSVLTSLPRGPGQQPPTPAPSEVLFSESLIAHDKKASAGSVSVDSLLRLPKRANDGCCCATAATEPGANGGLALCRLKCLIVS